MTAQFQSPPSLSLSTVPPSDLMIIDCAMSPSSSAGESCLWQTIKPIGPSATSARATATYRPSDQATKRPPSHTDNDRVIALNPSIKRGHHDIVAPPAAKLPRLLPLLSKKKKTKKKDLKTGGAHCRQHQQQHSNLPIAKLEAATATGQL